VTGLLLAASATAEHPSYRERPEPSVEIEDARGFALSHFVHAGQMFVLGEPGERYAIRIDNPTGERIEAVLTVDGRDAISGRIGDFRARGYVVPAGGSIVVDGFRRSLDAVATFHFSEPAQSYAARRGTPENVGVIGVAFFRERPPSPALPRRRRLPSRDDTSSESVEHSWRESRDALPRAPSAAERAAPKAARREEPAADTSGSERRDAARRSQGGRGESQEARSPWRQREFESAAPRGRVNNLGTEYGESRQSAVVEVGFERRSPQPERVLTIRYDDADGLWARGIDVRGATDPAWAEPQAFPNNRFAEPPPLAVWPDLIQGR
jgi:hypothetical protein